MKTPPLLLFLALLPAVAFASVGQVTTVEGEAVRVPAGGQAVRLSVGSAIELGDTLEARQGSLAIELADESTLMLAEGSRLRIDDARFGELERHFSAKLLLGSVWAAVTHALEGGSSFEVSTDRAAAGVRGTVFRVDVAADAKGEPQTEVSVEDGKVAVRPLQTGQVTPAATGLASEVLLGRGQGLRIGRALWQRFAAAVKAGAFERFIHRHREEALERRRRRLIRRIERRRR